LKFSAPDRKVPAPTAATAPVTNPNLSSKALRTASLAIAALFLMAAARVEFNIRGWRDRLIAHPSSQRIHTLAALPLENLSGDPGQEYFADGMTDEVITMLAKNSTLRITSRTSVMQYKGAHRPLQSAQTFLANIAPALGQHHSRSMLATSMMSVFGSRIPRSFTFSPTKPRGNS
jgi:hypothetical protein